MQVISILSRASAHLVLLSAFIATGCLVHAPEDVEEPQQTPPRLFVNKAVPPVTALHQTTIIDNEQPLFLVPFISDDLGEEIVGKLFLNYGLEGQRFLGTETRAPGTIDDLERTMEVAWSQNRTLDAGCYTITLTVTHRSNYKGDVEEPIDLEKTAFITWMVAHNIEPQDVTLDECPTPAVSPSGSF